LIVTSRTRLHLTGERVSVVAPFDVSSSHAGTPIGPLSPAVDLFVQRAMAARPGFQLGDADLPSVVELCRRLDGLPLAIELAAARMRTLSLSAILEHLDERLGLLTGGASERGHHESLGAAIAWSHDLLDPSTQRLYRRLSVFRGGWTLAAATALSRIEPASEVRALDSIAALQDVSLLVRLGPETAAPRFTMLESLRSFAEERLEAAGESEAARQQHALHYLGLVIGTAPRLTGPDQSAALDGLAVEHDNIRAALGYLVRSDPVEALRLVAAIWRFWQMRGHLVEGSRWVAEALEAAGEDAPDIERAAALAAAGGLAYWRGDMQEAEDRYAGVVALRRRIGDHVGIADAVFDLAFVFDPALRPPPEDPERTAAGIRLAEEAHELYLLAGHEPGIARSEWRLGSVIAGRDIESAKRLLSSSVERFRRLDDRFGLGWALHSYGLTLLRSVDSDSAAAAFGEALRLFSGAGDGSAIALLLEDFAEVAKAEGDALRASRLQGAASGARRTTEAELVVANPLWQLGDAVPRGLIDPAALEHAWADGRAMSQADAIAYALRSAAETVSDRELRVSALGPLVVERAGEPVSDWGGPKAGSRHALAIFAFLMDRGERGVSKDEFIEVLWPDAEVQQGDLNFHRTLGGLRSTLAASRGEAASAQTESIVFSNGRYRLASAVVGWLDVAEFQQRLLNAMEATDEISAIRGLEAARSLYRGDYLDDCPLYGDSPFVEERRRFLRGRLIDALVDLGRRYEARRETNLASSRFREALTVADGDCASAIEGLERLGVAAV
jgi:predicted ATPase/DNA-binding SARP family transcriptional activator